jgi:nucleoside 2-deoxyribosyltransferase
MGSQLSGRRPRCYVASPFGFTEAGRHYYNEVYLPALSAVVEPLDPWAYVTSEEVADALRRGIGPELARSIGRRNMEAIRSASVVVAYLEGPEPDAGTVAEVGYAAGLGLRCYGLRTDIRQAGELGMSLNLQVESFVLESGGVIVSSLDELVSVLAALAPGEQDVKPTLSKGVDPNEGRP